MVAGNVVIADSRKGDLKPFSEFFGAVRKQCFDFMHWLEVKVCNFIRVELNISIVHTRKHVVEFILYESIAEFRAVDKMKKPFPAEW